MRNLLRYLKDYKKESVLGPLFKLLEASFELFVPLVMAKIIDIGIRNQDVGYIIKMGGILILLGIIGLSCSLTAQYFARWQRRRLWGLELLLEMNYLDISISFLIPNLILWEQQLLLRG